MKPDMARVTLVLAVLWTFAGLTGHQPWKPDEGYSMGLAYSIAQGGSWVVPSLAGEPFMEKPPAFYLVAAATGSLFSSWLSFHDGARLAAGFFTVLALSCVAWAAALWWRNGSGAVLALVACIGLVVHAHLLLTDVGLIAGFAMAYLGFAHFDRRLRLGAFFFGTGVGIGFMTKGLLEPGAMGIMAVMLPVLFRNWRSTTYLKFLALATLWALPWLVIWPILLWQESRELFVQWFWVNNFGRFFGFAGLGPKAESWAYARILPWFAWPALPMAAWVCWTRRSDIRESRVLQIGVAGFGATLLVLGAAHDARALYAMPLLIPLALLSAGFPESISPKARAWTGMAGAVVYFGFAVLIWLAWSSLHFHWPGTVVEWMNRQQPGFVPLDGQAPMVVALLATATWLGAILIMRHDRQFPLFAWSAGIALVWILSATLLMQWVDAGKSYYAVMTEVSARLPKPLTCLATRNLGEPQRALVHYYLGTLPRRTEISSPEKCNAMLVQIRLAETKVVTMPGEGWTLRWEGARAGDEKERFWLFVR
jgi:4-amino-4-deoxy-L-arabinose transferase-like glycosyltransferase